MQSDAFFGKHKKRAFSSRDRKKRNDDVIEEDSDVESAEDPIHEDEADDASETPAQKRLRLAQMYLDSLRKDDDFYEGGADAADMDREAIAARLQQDVLAHSGKTYLYFASKLRIADAFVRARACPKHTHRKAVTGVAFVPNSDRIISASKDGSIVLWGLTKEKLVPLDVRGGAKRKSEQGHRGSVNAISVSSDGKYLATAGSDNALGIWSIGEDEVEPMSFLRGHRLPVTDVQFQKNSSRLFTCSQDRTIKMYDAKSLAYLDTLYGHQEPVLSLSMLHNERLISAGGRDCTVRYWKVPEESQLVFRAGVTSRLRRLLDGETMDDNDILAEKDKYIEGSVDCVAMIDDSTFVSAGDSGAISTWSTGKKKPVNSRFVCHGVVVTHADNHDAPAGEIVQPRWITAIAALPYGDIVATGSYDGQIRIWGLENLFIRKLGSIPVSGVVTSLEIVPLGNVDSGELHTIRIVASVSRESRLGRWIVENGKNQIVTIDVPVDE